MTYDKTEMNAFVQNLYDQKMQEGKHGHYETMFHVVHAAIAAYTEKLLDGVEMPEYKYIDRHDVPKEGMCVYTQDQLQSYAAAAAAQSRLKALDEAKQVCANFGGFKDGHSCADAIEQLKEKP